MRLSLIRENTNIVGSNMKRLPKNIPSRYQEEWKEDEKEWRFRKKVRYTNPEGKKIDTTTKWHWTIDECEAEAKEIIAEGQYVEKEKELFTTFTKNGWKN